MIQQTFRRSARPALFAPKIEEELRVEIGVQRDINLVEGHEGDILSSVTALTVGGGMTVIRTANDQAILTLVRNSGDSNFSLYEGGFLVRILTPGETARMPLNGMHAISATATGNTTAEVTTYLRPDCEDDMPTEPVPIYLWAGLYKYLCILDWDGSLQFGPGFLVDSITMDATVRNSPDWPAGAYEGAVPNPGGVVDGHTTWIILPDGVTTRCVSAVGDSEHAAENFGGHDYLGFEDDAQSIYESIGFSGTCTEPNGGVSIVGDPTITNGIAGILCHHVTDQRGTDPS